MKIQIVCNSYFLSKLLSNFFMLYHIKNNSNSIDKLNLNKDLTFIFVIFIFIKMFLRC